MREKQRLNTSKGMPFSKATGNEIAREIFHDLWFDQQKEVQKQLPKNEGESAILSTDSGLKIKVKLVGGRYKLSLP